MAVNLRPRIGDVGQHTRRSEKHVILDRCACIDRNIVLNFHIAADYDAIRDKSVLAENTLFTNPGSGADVGKMPNLGACANSRPVINYCGRMSKI
jgi:hypothetical protein